MFGWCYILAVILTPMGLVLLAVGVVLRLCEGSWGKRRGELGSTGFFAAGGLLCLPLAALLLPGLVLTALGR